MPNHFMLQCFTAHAWRMSKRNATVTYDLVNAGMFYNRSLIDKNLQETFPACLIASFILDFNDNGFPHL